MSDERTDLLHQVAKRLSEPLHFAEGIDQKSILALSARSYGAGLDDEQDELEPFTQPTGFNLDVAALFEAIIEGAFLVANADGEFDDTEKAAFKQVVIAACDGKVSEAQLDALIADFSDLLKEDGIEKRVAMVAHSVKQPQHAREVLRIAGLLAAVSAGVSEEERHVLEQLAAQLGLEQSALDATLEEVKTALGG